MAGKLLVIQVAGLNYDPPVEGLSFQQTQSVLPAVTCTVQGSFRTACPPSLHGMIANGLYFRDVRKVAFWEQSAGLVAGPRIWEAFRAKGRSVAMLFWQQSMGEAVDMLLSPAPVHKHHGGMIDDCYCQPPGLYNALCEAVGRPFRLRHYWGPLASAKVGDWIAEATAAMLVTPGAPELCLTYLPTLDYDFQRYGPGHQRCGEARNALARQLGYLAAVAREAGYDLVVFGDYAMAEARGSAAFPNQALLDAGLMACREVRGMLYPDLHASRAFAVVDHEVAHVYVCHAADIAPTADLLAAADGVGHVLAGQEKAAAGLDHPNSGELVLLAADGRWFAYPWWREKPRRPDYATHVDIHNKPGFDPCELFFGRLPIGTSQDASRVGGSHGRTGPGREVVWAATIPLERQPADLIELAAGVRGWLERQS
jgi:predicted AlkP superfamily pyrophosphatase or phosphodiesterase